nr:hypothetical protein B0A51_00796 [Rachicladosporium sp. CCFEE 5018]
MAPSGSRTPKLDKLKQQLRDLGIEPGKTVAECKELLRLEREKVERAKALRKQLEREKAAFKEAQRQAQRTQRARSSKPKHKRAASGSESEEDEVYEHFQQRYGSDDNDLAAWQQLCRDLELEPGPSKTQCKKRIAEVYVYIKQMVLAQKNGAKIDKLATFSALYRTIKKYGAYPLAAAKDNCYLKVMLKTLPGSVTGAGRPGGRPQPCTRSGAPPPGSYGQRPAAHPLSASGSNDDSSHSGASEAEGAAVVHGDVDDNVADVAGRLSTVGLDH